MPCAHQLTDDEMCELCPPLKGGICTHDSGTYRRDGEIVDRCLRCTRPLALSLLAGVEMRVVDRPEPKPAPDVAHPLERSFEEQLAMRMLSGTPMDVSPLTPLVLAGLSREDLVGCAEDLTRIAQRTLALVIAHETGDRDAFAAARHELDEAVGLFRGGVLVGLANARHR